MVDTEDKSLWVKIGLDKEYEFVEFMKSKKEYFPFDVSMNPEKKTNPYVPDLMVKGRICDLKTQETPFFTSPRDPQYSVSFNLKDYRNYIGNYPNILVLFWINWLVLEGYFRNKVYRVKPMNGVWACYLDGIKKMVDDGAPLHEYKRRIGDKINSTHSYILDVREMLNIVPDQFE